MARIGSLLALALLSGSLGACQSAKSPLATGQGKATPSQIVKPGAGLIGNDGAGLTGGTGGQLIGNDGAGVQGPLGTAGVSQDPGASKPPASAVGALKPGAAPVGEGALLPNPGTVLAPNAGLIGNDGAGLIGNDGAGLIGRNGQKLIANDGAGFQFAGGFGFGEVGTESLAPLSVLASLQVQAPAALRGAQAVGFHLTALPVGYQPVPGAVVEIVLPAGTGLGEPAPARADAQGRLALANVPAGTRFVAHGRAPSGQQWSFTTYAPSDAAEVVACPGSSMALARMDDLRVTAPAYASFRALADAYCAAMDAQVAEPAGISWAQAGVVGQLALRLKANRAAIGPLEDAMAKSRAISSGASATE